MTNEVDGMPHADLECPECEQLCKPIRGLKNGGASYKCLNEKEHPDFAPLMFTIDGEGHVQW